MSSTLDPTDPTRIAEADAAQPPTLAQLRVDLDQIDDAIHDLLMRRAEVVEQVGAHGAKGRVAIRPGREASIIRRLLGRHRGGLPPRLLVRLWRELFAATTSMQGSYVITVCEADPAGTFVQAAREHFGALTPLRRHRTPAQAIGEVSSGAAIAAVLPMPQEEEPNAAAWWTALLHRDEPRIHVVGRLPFWAPRSEGGPQAQALVVAAVAPDASSADPSRTDRSLIGLELSAEASRARLSGALATAGFDAGAIILRRDPGAQEAQALVDVAGLVGEDDPRLAALSDMLRPPVVLGSYAVPVDGDSV
jgi:chorismate mutase/prephenate dehydratase